MDHIVIKFRGEPDVLEALPSRLDEMNMDVFLIDGETLTTSIAADHWDSEVELRLHLLSSAFGLEMEVESLTDQDWNRAWEESFTPIRIGTFCLIRASFHSSDADVLYDIIIDPKMAFGTGHHETTYLMLSYMQKLEFAGKRVVDYGAGTGVLGILACKMNAAQVCYYENDPVASVNLRENVVNNSVAARSVVVQNRTHSHLPEHVDIALVNITRNVIHDALPNLADCLTEGGYILMSGFLHQDVASMETRGRNLSLLLLDQRQEGDWSMMVFVKV